MECVRSAWFLPWFFSGGLHTYGEGKVSLFRQPGCPSAKAIRCAHWLCVPALQQFCQFEKESSHNDCTVPAYVPGNSSTIRIFLSII